MAVTINRITFSCSLTSQQYNTQFQFFSSYLSPTIIILNQPSMRSQSGLETNSPNSFSSSPRSDYFTYDNPRVRLMCSFAGKILPRPQDNQLRYVGGDTRIVSVHRHTTFSTLLFKLSKVSGTSNVWIKYQLPNDDLDALISVTADEDVDNMMDEYDRLTLNHPNPKAVRLRIFLFPKDEHSRANNIASLLHGAENRDAWFFDAVNSGGGRSPVLERLRSDSSSIFSEVPDHFFGFDINSDEPKLKTQPLTKETGPLSGSDPPYPVRDESFTFISMSSVPTLPLMPNLKPVKTKPDKPVPFLQEKKNFPEMVETPVKKALEYSPFLHSPCSPFMHSPCSPFMHYVSDPQYPGHVIQAIPVYYVTGPVQPVQVWNQYVQPYPAGMCPIPMVYPYWDPTMGQVYNAPLMPVMAQDRMEEQMLYGMRNVAMVPTYPDMVVSGGEVPGT